MEIRSTPAAVVDAPPKAGRLTRIIGRAVPYGVATDVGGGVVETIAPGAFRDSLNTEPRLPLLTFHDRQTDPVGVAVAWQERTDGLHGTWELDDSDRAQEVGRLVQRGLLAFLSIGFQTTHGGDRWTVVDGREHVTVTRARLFEVSLVPTPAYAEAAVTGIRSVAGSLAELARQVSAPLLPAAITGTPAEVRTAVGLVRAHVREYGGHAPDYLEQLAASACAGPQLSLNLARAAAALTDALLRTQLDQVRARTNHPRGPRLGPVDRPPTRRRHRR